MLDHEGKEVPGNRGYKYFGAARDLPGVRELFETERTYQYTSSFQKKYLIIGANWSRDPSPPHSCPGTEEDEGRTDEGRGC